jgi:hypothetical protein
LGSSPISQDVSKIINILATSFDPLNGASLQGDATTDQAGAANDVAKSVGEAPPTPVSYQTTVRKRENDSEPAFD